MTLNCTCTLVSGSSSPLQKKPDQKHLNRIFVATFRVSWLPEKISTIDFFFERKQNFLRAVDFMLRFFLMCSGAYCQMVISSEWIWPPDLEIMWSVWESRNSKSGSHKTKIFIDEVPFTFHPLVGLMHNTTTSKEPTDWPSYCLQ